MIITRLAGNDNFGSIQMAMNTNKGGAKCVLNLSRYLEKIVKEKIRGKSLGTHSFARRYYNFASTMLSTLLDRYSKVTVGSNTPVYDLALCFNDFAEKFCNDYRSLAKFYVKPCEHYLIDEFLVYANEFTLGLLSFVQTNSDPDALNFHYSEYMRALQEKNLQREDYDKEVDEFSVIIDFFSKKQAKPDIRHFFEERLKAGQGVSAFQKHINALLAPYSRHAADLFHKMLKPNVLFASNEPDAQIGAKLAELMHDFQSKHPNAPTENFANDFTEYDSSQFMLSPYANSVLMMHMGAPTSLIDLYIAMRSAWNLSDRMVKLYGHEKMHSGEPFTLAGNTFFGMLILAHALCWDQLSFAIFKGDDSALCGVNIRFEPKVIGFCRTRGLVLKAEYPPHMEFAGLFITEYGFFPDLVRKIVKFLSTVYRDLSHYNNAILNLKADLACITCYEHVVAGCIATSAYYNFCAKVNTIKPDDVLLLLSFLHEQTKVVYADLPDVNSDVFHVYSCMPENNVGGSLCDVRTVTFK